MGADATLQKAFETRVKAWADVQVPPIPVAYGNAPFTPPVSGGRYVRATVLPASTGSNDLQGKGRSYAGVFHVLLVLPQNIGSQMANSLAESLDPIFPVGPPLVQDGFNVWMMSPMSKGPPIPEPDHYTVPVSARYRAEVFIA